MRALTGNVAAKTYRHKLWEYNNKAHVFLIVSYHNEDNSHLITFTSTMKTPTYMKKAWNTSVHMTALNPPYKIHQYIYIYMYYIYMNRVLTNHHCGLVWINNAHNRMICNKWPTHLSAKSPLKLSHAWVNRSHRKPSCTYLSMAEHQSLSLCWFISP